MSTVSALTSSVAMARPALTLLKKMRSSVRTGRKLHLTTEEIAILLRPEIYEAISRLEAEEMRRACALNAENDNTGWAASGSGNAPTPELGASAGLSVVDKDAIQRG